MKLSLQLKLGQQLAMTPQLQQAIRLLQLSTLDLQQEIHQALESNPMLELIEGIEEDENQATDAEANTESASQTADSPDNKTADNLDEEYWQSEIPKDLEVDSSWDDVYTNSPPPSQNS
ncbi:MAG: RNA polymerase factor sigma-54, partial [Pseudomonadota bacterium]|nr:RNA polymerase factor sigma-54 [Pseudomonadota bacterium]